MRIVTLQRIASGLSLPATTLSGSSAGGILRPEPLRSRQFVTTIALPMVILLLTVAGRAQDFTYATNAGQIHITGYTGTGGAVVIPATITGLPVTVIGSYAFQDLTNLTSVAIPSTVTTIEDWAFAFTTLKKLVIPSSVTQISQWAFAYSYELAHVYFQGNAPTIYDTDDNNFDPFGGVETVYYLPGTTGWSPTFGGRIAGSVVLWNPTASATGLQAGQFGFTITASSSLVVVVEACTDLTTLDWNPVSTNALTGGSTYFSDPQWSSFPSRVYRLRPR